MAGSTWSSPTIPLPTISIAIAATAPSRTSATSVALPSMKKAARRLPWASVSAISIAMASSTSLSPRFPTTTRLSIATMVTRISPTLLLNAVKNENHWLTLKLVGGRKSPRDAIGAKVFLTAGGVRQRADVFSGGSYGSNSDPRVHFGLGATTRVDRLEIRWPSGAVEDVPVPGIDRIFTVVEGKGSSRL